MSRCRCSDIASIESKIEQLEKAQRIVSGYYGRKDVRDNKLLQCSLYARQATVSNKVASNHAAIIALGNEMDQTASNISGKISARLTELRDEMSDLRRKDREYHEEQRRIQEAAARALEMEKASRTDTGSGRTR